MKKFINEYFAASGWEMAVVLGALALALFSTGALAHAVIWLGEQ